MSEHEPGSRRALWAALAGLIALLATPAALRAEPAVTTVAAAPQQQEARSYALIVAHNGSVDEGVAPLRYADDDGARYYETFSELTDETLLLTQLDADSQRVFPGLAAKSSPPTRAELRAAVLRLSRRVAQDRAAGRRAEVYLVFTGHGQVDAGGEGYLSLADGPLHRSELYREVIQPLNASYTHLIIDACHAYFMVQSRGGGSGDAEQPWQDDRSEQGALDEEWRAYVASQDGKNASARRAELGTVGVIVSTSGTAEVHEWSALRGGVFSHMLRSGLLGGADIDGDGRVSYSELEAFLAAANASVTNPRARIQVYMRAPSQDRAHALLHLDHFRRATRLALPASMQGRYHVEDARGLRYADVNLGPGHHTQLVLLRGPVGDRPYYLRREGQEEASVPLIAEHVNGGELAFASLSAQARSSVEASLREELFATPLSPAFYAGYMASRSRYESALEAREVGRRGVSGEGGARRQVELSYGVSAPLSRALYDVGGVQHAANLSLTFGLGERGWAVGPYLGYGGSAHDDAVFQGEAQLHRLTLGVQLEREMRLTSRVSLAPRLRFGPQAVWLRSEAVCPAGACVDPVGLRGSASLAMVWQATPRLTPLLELGWSADVLTRAGLERNEETLAHSPMLSVGLRF